MSPPRPNRLEDGRYEWRLRDPARNARLVDAWSLAHVAWGFALAMALPWWLALALMTLWEPVEILLVSPVLARLGVRFGYEGLKNSVADLGFNGLGVALAALVVRPAWDPLAGVL